MEQQQAGTNPVQCHCNPDERVTRWKMRKTNPSTRRDASLKLHILMNSSVPEDSETASDRDAAMPIQPVHKPADSEHLDPITGEPHAHPVGVGVGALGAGAAGGLIGAILGPVGAVIGAAIGAVTGGLAGKEVAESAEHKQSVLPMESVEPPASEADLSHDAETTYDDVGTSAAHASLVEEPMAYDRGSSFEGDPSASAAEPLEAPASHSGPGHVTAASLVSKASTTASGYSAPEKAIDPIAEDMDRQAAPETVPFSASALPGDDEFAPQRLPLTPEDTDVHVASVPNDVPKIDQPKGPLNHDILFDHGNTPAATAQPRIESGNQVHTAENTPESSVRTKAYYNYLNRQQSGRQGDELGDWVEAEYDVLKS